MFQILKESVVKNGLRECKVVITAKTSVTDTLHKKFNVTGMEEGDGGCYITITASDSKYCVFVCIAGVMQRCISYVQAAQKHCFPIHISHFSTLALGHDIHVCMWYWCAIILHCTL